MLNIKNTFLIACIIVLILTVSNQSTNRINSFSTNIIQVNDSKVIIQVKEPVIGIVQIREESNNNSIIIVGYLSRILAINLTTNGILWNYTYGMNESLNVFIWKIIPNSFQQEEVSGVYVSLSNGTIFEVSKIGEVVWKTVLGAAALSSLALTITTENINFPFYLITGGDNNQTTWLTPEGSIVQNHTLSSEITIIKTNNHYTLVGTRSGDIYVFNDTNLLWSKNIGNNQVLAINQFEDTVIANSYGGNVSFFDLKNGDIMFSKEYGLLTYNSIHILDQQNNQAYLFKSNGELLATHITNGSIVWTNSEIPSYATNIIRAEFTGDLDEDLIVSTGQGHIYILNSSTGESIHFEQIISKKISIVLAVHLNSDNITDLFLGTLNGKVIQVFGIDFSPPLEESSVPSSDNGILQFPFDIGAFMGLLFGTSIILGLMGTGYFYNQHRYRQRALRNGKDALENKDYITAIQSFYKAKAEEKIVEVVKLLILNPSLSDQMSEIRKMKVLEQYITFAEEIIELTHQE